MEKTIKGIAINLPSQQRYTAIPYCTNPDRKLYSVRIERQSTYVEHIIIDLSIKEAANFVAAFNTEIYDKKPCRLWA